MDSIMTLSEISKYLKLSEKTLQKMVKNNKIPCTKIANQWRFSQEMIDEWLRNKMEITRGDNMSRIIEEDSHLITLSRLIDEDSMIMNLKSTSKKGIFTELADLALKNKCISDKNYLIEKLLEREELTSTAIGMGVAIPHLRKPSSSIISGPRIMIGISPEGVDFNCFDGLPTFIFFLILSDSEIVHLRILSKLAAFLRKEEVQNKISTLKTSKGFMTFFIELEKDNYKGVNL